MSASSSARRPLAGLIVIGLGISLAAMDLAVNVAFPAIGAAFELQTRRIRWVVICYVLTYASLTLAFGRLGDRIGHRRVFGAGLWVCAAAFVLCALAPSYEWLLGARVAQGVGTALVLSCAPALATSLFAESRRTHALGAYGSMFAGAAVIAPLLGGFCISLLGWSGAFWFRAPIAGIALLLLPLLRVSPQTAPAASHAAADLIGSGLLAFGLAALLLAASLIHSDLPAALAPIHALGGVLALSALAWHQRRTADPLFPRTLSGDPDFLLANLVAIAVHFVAFGVPLLVPFYLANIGAYAAASIGAILALSPAGMLLGSLCAARAARVVGAKAAALLGGSMVAIGSLWIGLWLPATALPVILVSLLLHGVGLGLFQVAYADDVVAALPRAARGVAGSLTMVTRTIGVVTAATALTAVLTTLERLRLDADDSAASAFETAFSVVFLGAAVALAMVLLLAGLRRGVWAAR